MAVNENLSNQIAATNMQSLAYQETIRPELMVQNMLFEVLTHQNLTNYAVHAKVKIMVVG
jgi:hypothetical protein